MSRRPVVKVGGSALSEEQHTALRDMRVTRGLGVPAYARLSFSVQLDGPTITPKLGDDIVLTVDGDADTNWTLFKGVVVGLGIELDTGFNQNLVVEAYDKLYQLGRESKAAAYLNQSPKDVVDSLASAAGLSASVDSSFPSTSRPAAFQYGTAFAYVEAMVREAGFEWYVDDTTLHVKPRAGGTSTEFNAKVGENLQGFSARVNATNHVNSVTVTGWDVQNKSAIVGTATSDGAGSRSVVDLASASKVNASAVKGKSAVSIPRPVADQTEAEKLAAGIVHRSEAALLRARGELIPNSAIEPGILLVVSGLAGQWDGKYYCTEVEHVWGGSTGSLRTFFEVGSAEPESLVDIFGSSSSASLDHMLHGLTIGIVTDNKDPDQLNRVKLKLPYLSDTEQTGWCRVLQPGAGAGRGWNVLPEVDDEVLVGFEHGDIDHAYVLGGLVNGTDKPPYLGADGDLLDSGKVAARTFTSRLGHEIYVADGAGADKQYIQMNTAGKEATLFLGKEKTELLSASKPMTFGNSKGSIAIAENGDITIKGAKVTIDGTGTVKIDSKADLAAKGATGAKVEGGTTLDLKAGTGATVDGGAMTTIKGAMVKIN